VFISDCKIGNTCGHKIKREMESTSAAETEIIGSYNVYIVKWPDLMSLSLRSVS